MKKFKILVTLLICLVLALTDCGSKVGKEAVSQGKLEEAQKEYDKALGTLKLAKSEGIKDKEVEFVRC